VAPALFAGFRHALLELDSCRHFQTGYERQQLLLHSLATDGLLYRPTSLARQINALLREPVCILSGRNKQGFPSVTDSFNRSQTSRTAAALERMHFAEQGLDD